MTDQTGGGLAAAAGALVRAPDHKVIFDTVRPWLDREGFSPARVAALDAAIRRSVGLEAATPPPAAIAAPVAAPGAVGFYVDLLEHVAGRKADDSIRAVAAALAAHAPAYGQDKTPERMAEFVAQIAHETGGFTRFEENLRYSARRLMQVWPRRFPTLASAFPYAWDSSDPDREDQALANKTYGGRMGNEDDGTADNDGWDYRGRGALQLTGLDQYKAAGEALGLPLVDQPDLAADPAIGTLIALHFFKQNGVNAYIDRGDFKAARGITNAGDPNFANPHGLAEVAQRRRKALEVLR
jgi:putative chitinase